MIREFGFTLPPFAYWSPDEFRANRGLAETIITARCGWDITDPDKILPQYLPAPPRGRLIIIGAGKPCVEATRVGYLCILLLRFVIAFYYYGLTKNPPA